MIKPTECDSSVATFIVVVHRSKRDRRPVRWFYSNLADARLARDWAIGMNIAHRVQVRFIDRRTGETAQTENWQQ